MTNLTPEATLSKTSSKGSEQRDIYLTGLLETARRAVPPTLPLADLRATATALAKEQSFPFTKLEDWRFTDLSPMLSMPFQAVTGDGEADAAVVKDLSLPEANGARLVWVNGRWNAALSQTDALPAGVRLGNLQSLWGDGSGSAELQAKLAQIPGGHEVFTALNTAGFQDAAVLWVPRNTEVGVPVQILYLSTPQATPVMAQPRCLVVAESGSAVTLVEDFWGQGTVDHFTNAVTEIWVDANAQVNHIRLQREGQGTFHIGKTAVAQDRDSRYCGTTVALGARLSRHHLEVYQQGPQTETQVYGLGNITDSQHTDTHSLIALNHPYGTVNQLHKCIVDDHAHSVFSGRIAVPQQAQLTQASQLNRNLLLSDKARVDTKPQLEIVADNVKCAHGATVSQLEADEIFYLQSRGIDAAQAQRLLIYAFAMEIIDTLPVPSLKAQLTSVITDRTREP